MDPRESATFALRFDDHIHLFFAPNETQSEG
jgi:hypothetical protein